MFRAKPLISSPIALLAVLGLLLAAGAVAPAFAQGIQRIGDFGDWSAFQIVEGGNRLCYMASQPKKAEGDYTKRGEIYAIVTHRPSEKLRDEVSIVAGYTYKGEAPVQVAIGDQAFEMLTHGDGAWARDTDTDQKLVKAMIKGRSMVVKGTSSRGTATTDTYSLNGFTKAYEAINKACGL